MSKKGFGKFLLGAGIGATLGLLFAPKKGSETRKEWSAKIQELLTKASEIDVEEVKANVEEKIAEIEAELETLDKEKVLKIAKEQAKKIQIKSQELVDYAVLKGTPILEHAAAEVKEQAILVTKEILAKLEK